MLKTGNSLIAHDLINFAKLTRFKNDNNTNKNVNTIQKTVLLAFSTASSRYNQSSNREWTKILARAEKQVGYATSLWNRKYLLADEISNFANLLKKISNSKHPLMHMAKKFVLSSAADSESKRTLQFKGILILLIAKAAGMPNKMQHNRTENDIADGIHVSQRSLAEITEMIYIGSLIHKGIIDLSALTSSSLDFTQMNQGNKLAVLCGDFLLATACKNLSMLKNTQVVGLMSEVIAEISQTLFLKENLTQSQNSATSPSYSHIKLWYDTVNSNSSSLLANSAKAALLLVSHSNKLQEIAWQFARNLDITHKIWCDLMNAQNDKTHLIGKESSILNAIYRDRYENVALIENKKLASSAYSGFTSSIYQLEESVQNSVINECKLIFDDHFRLATENLKQLENENSAEDAITSLRAILNTMKSSI